MHSIQDLKAASLNGFKLLVDEEEGNLTPLKFQTFKVRSHICVLLIIFLHMYGELILIIAILGNIP